ncbi:MAG: hypothetical protein H0W68_12805, partial [Gemmatimonadaceae bacterium]|nr:hypothetical protein [Gemmatimonadaceae bacterium]
MQTDSFPIQLPPAPLANARSVEHRLQRFAIWVSIAVAALGAIVLVGWYAGIPLFTQIAPSFVAMQFNTAATFVLAAVALSALVTSRMRIALLAGVAVLLVGGVTIAENLTGWSAGIDELLWRAGADRDAMGELSRARLSAPGRMAPNTALGFVLVGLATLLLVQPGRGRFVQLASSAVVAILATSLGAVALSGYLIGVPTAYGWGHLARMSVHAAAGMALLGCGFLAATMQVGLRQQMPVRGWFPALSGTAVAIGTLMMWQSLVDHNRRNLEGTIRREAETIAGAAGRGIDERVLITEHLAAQWSDEHALVRGEWERTAASMQRGFAGVIGVGVVDSHGILRWVVPASSTTLVADAPFAVDARRVALLREATTTGRGTLSLSDTLGSGRRFALAAAPMRSAMPARAFVVAALDYRTMFEDVVSQRLGQVYSYSVRDGAQ